MPRFFFHVARGQDILSDPTGMVLRDTDHALITAGSIIADMTETVVGEPPGDFEGWQLHICGEDGSVVDILPIAPRL